MKKIILTCAMLLAVSAVSFAQNTNTTATSAAATSNRPSPAQVGEARAKSMQQQYNFTDDQYKKSVAIETAFFTQQMDMRAAAAQNPNDQTNRVKMADIMAKKDAQYKQMLTPEQAVKYEASKTRSMPSPSARPAGASLTAPAGTASPMGHN